MKICAAQAKPIKGDIQRNIENHKRLIEQAIAYKADVIIFPELSLTGYEPALAKKLATSHDDSRFEDFQKISDAHQIIIGVGMPTKSNEGICISLILFRPHNMRLIYSKKYLHPDEEEFFVGGENFPVLKVEQTTIAFAICFEISIAAHVECAVKSRANMYIASVAKFDNGIDKAINTLSGIASSQSMMVIMANSIGQSDGHDCAGKSSIWNKNGLLIGQLDRTHEGILLVDINTQEVIEKII
jgi:predicted amidohydrolase